MYIQDHFPCQNHESSHFSEGSIPILIHSWFPLYNFHLESNKVSFLSQSPYYRPAQKTADFNNYNAFENQLTTLNMTVYKF